MARADAMSQEALQACIRDEQTYQFTHFSHRDAWELGHALVSACEQMGAPLAVEIERTWSEVQESYAQILLMRRSVESSAENLRQNRNFYKAGTAPLTDLLDAETLYTQSRNDLTSACASYRTALAKYMRVTGR